MATQIGVRTLVEFVLRQGDLNARLNSQNTAWQGAKLHRALQQAHREADYQKEVYLKQTVTLAGQDYVIDGRADGVWSTAGDYTVEEIKTSDVPFETLPDNQLTLYWGQAQVYGHFLCHDFDLPAINLELVYYQTDNDAVTRVQRRFKRAELADFFEEMVQEYSDWLQMQAEWHQTRDQSAQQLQFPFGDYRPNQRQLAVAVYKTIARQKELFVEAPTGTGKTISTLFPAIKALGAGQCQRLFYLTAKQSTRQVAEETLALLATKQLRLKSVTLTAKDQITFPEEVDVPPEQNPYFLGYYDRLKPALRDLMAHEDQWTRAVIETYARKHQVDPFEFSLDAALLADVVICDYNYLFDPIVYLQRFFADTDPNQVFLIDEAHNLVDRSRSMYSAALASQPVADLVKQLKPEPKLQKATKTLRAAFTALSKPLRDAETTQQVQAAPAETFQAALFKWQGKVHDWLGAQEPDAPLVTPVLTVYFQALTYLKISDLYGDNYQTLIQYDPTQRQTTIKQLCLDSAPFLKQCLAKGGSAILFSATLTPLSYYQQVLGGTEASFQFQVPSPFPPAHQALLIAQYVQTTYQQRAANLPKIVASLGALVQGKVGNYLCFLPSYQYLTTVQTAFEQAYPAIETCAQTPTMTAAERTAFLAQFQPEPTATLLGFAVLGGSFAEGIDLKGERLIGVAVVSVGLPGLSVERNLVRDYFQQTQHAGFQYAYQLPGLNHVLQAAGRLIRDTADRGIILLLDQRFGTPRYTQFFPAHWQFYQRLTQPQQLSAQIQQFWAETARKQ
ncbi:ATP-dependent DNA helicase [Loigolactobacillus bifermentans]|uniref:Putative DNA helicase (Putative) n=1 Tax=Loigolactobacillus bifermentans DSM 20003 TaxID=1423726 RepID=A0A0R1H0H2_9LACO|nr:ATP-dependent DNA helicase [Loigolactobacillus bifermentans]KRK40125.1 putative DNA helicase (putative) [Loigolactobacillus bifermentans DSM 20003]QGG60873.1 ATP-dependent DNA helicase [Loigolactobacillus bifermentans]